MTEAEYCTRKAFENATEDYVRGAVWAIMKVYELIPHNAIEHEHETIQQIIDLENTFQTIFLQRRTPLSSIVEQHGALIALPL